MKRKRGKKGRRQSGLSVSDAPADIMPSQATSVTDSSVGPHSVTDNARSVGISELAVPELDSNVSTEDFSSDYLSAWTASGLEPDSRIVESHEEIATSNLDAASVYSPNHYPAPPLAYRIEEPYEIDEDTLEDDTLDSTRSVNELDLNYVTENGRRYCGSYYMPNDDDEQVRLQLINQVYLKTFDGELTSVPLEAPTHILDIGTGVGEWAIDMAELYPDCEVTGTDIANIFERRVPRNVFWEIDDAEIEWERPPNHYDLVHLRDLVGSFADWQSIYRYAFDCIKPGGWIEVLDFDDHKGMSNLHSLFEPNSLVCKVANDLVEAALMHGRPHGVAHLEPRFLVNAGYVDVQLTEHAIPLKTDDGSTGKFWLLAMLNGAEAVCLRLLTKYKGWDPEEVRLACDLMGQEMMAMALKSKKSKSFVVKVRVLKGRKPGLLPRWSRGPSREPSQLMQQKLMEMLEDTEGESSQPTDGESGYLSVPSEMKSGVQSASLGSSLEQGRPNRTQTVSGTTESTGCS